MFAHNEEDPRTRTESLRKRGQKWDEKGNPVVQYAPLFKEKLDGTGYANSHEVSRNLTVVTADLMKLLWSYGCPMFQIHGCARACNHAEWYKMDHPTRFGTHYFYNFCLYGEMTADPDALREAWFDVFKVCYKENLGEDIITKFFYLYPCVYTQWNNKGETLLHFAMKYLPDSHLVLHDIGTCSHFANKKDIWGRLPLHYGFWSKHPKSCGTLAELVSYYPAALGTYAPHQTAVESAVFSWLETKLRLTKCSLAPNSEVLNLFKMIMNNWPAAVLLENKPSHKLPLDVNNILFNNGGYRQLARQMKFEVSNALAECCYEGLLDEKAKECATAIREQKDICDGNQPTCDIKHLVSMNAFLQPERKKLTEPEKTLHRCQHRLLNLLDQARDLAMWKVGPERTLPVLFQTRINILCRINRAGGGSKHSYVGLINRQSQADILEHASSDPKMLSFFVKKLSVKEHCLVKDPREDRSLLADTVWRRSQFQEQVDKVVAKVGPDNFVQGEVVLPSEAATQADAGEPGASPSDGRSHHSSEENPDSEDDRDDASMDNSPSEDSSNDD